MLISRIESTNILDDTKVKNKKRVSDMPIKIPVLYVLRSDVRCQQAISLLENSPWQYELKEVEATHPYVSMYGLPLLIAPIVNFQGLQGIEAFLENAVMLGCEKR